MITKAASIAGGGKQTLAAALGLPGLKARAVQFIGDSANTGNPLFGGSDISNGTTSPLVHPTGFPILKTVPTYLPLITESFEFYDFDNIYVYVGSADVLYVAYELG